jgi:hypothetical protein
MKHLWIRFLGSDQILHKEDVSTELEDCLAEISQLHQNVLKLN